MNTVVRLRGSGLAIGLAILLVTLVLLSLPSAEIARAAGTDLIITGVIDGPLTGGTPKAIEFYVLNDIADLSIYGFGSANNGGGSDGQEFTFPADAAAKGDCIYVASESPNFSAFFEFAPDYVGGAANINGDDAIELFYLGAVVDVFGDINMDGNGQPWEYLDGWAYRVDGTGPDGTTFVLENWTFSGPNELDGETTNATAAVPFPLGTYVPAAPSFIISKSGPDMVSPSEVFTYTIVVANSTGISTTGTVITDVVPAHAEFAFASDEGFLAGDTVQWTVTGNFTAGLTLTRTFQVTATSSSGMDIVNDDYGVQATNWLTLAAGTPVTTTVSPLDLTAENTGPEYVLLGENVVYTITLNNTGVTTATNVVLTDTLPFSSTYVSDDSLWTCDACMPGASGVITWSVGDVSPNDGYSFNLTVTAGVAPLGTAALPLVNQVQVSTDVAGDDPSNNSDQCETTAYPHVSIYDIQYVADPAVDDASPFEDRMVRTEGIVVANLGDQVFIQDGAGAWNGIMLYRPSGTLNVGDHVQVSGTVIEYYGMTEFAYGADTTVISSGNALPAPALITAAEIFYNDASVSEQYESVFVEARDVTVTAIESYGIWAFTDASGGTGKADDTAYTPDPAVDDVFAILRGPIIYDYSQYKVLPRDADDAIQGNVILIEKTAPASVALGEVFTYTLTVANQKGFDLDDVLITDAVPDNATFAYALDGGAEAGGGEGAGAEVGGASTGG